MNSSDSLRLRPAMWQEESALIISFQFYLGHTEICVHMNQSTIPTVIHLHCSIHFYQVIFTPCLTVPVLGSVHMSIVSGRFCLFPDKVCRHGCNTVHTAVASQSRPGKSRVPGLAVDVLACSSSMITTTWCVARKIGSI